MPEPLQNVTLRTLDLALLQAGRRHQGRVREPAEGADRRGEELADADHPLHRRSAHDDRRRRRGGPGRRRQPAQAGARARRAAHDRGDHVGRVQEVLREGSRALTPLPAREGRGAERGACLAMLRGVVPALEAHHNVRITGRRTRRRRAAVASLSARPPAARQGGERAGHGVRAPRAGPATRRRRRSRTRARRLDDLAVQTRVLEREAALGVDHHERLAEIAAARVDVGGRAGAAERRGGKRSAGWSSRSARFAARSKPRTESRCDGGRASRRPTAEPRCAARGAGAS